MICHFVVDRVDHYSIELRNGGNGTYSLHALRYPPNCRGGGVHKHHLYPSNQICISAGSEPRTLDRAKAIAMSWCEGWSAYQKTGVFPNGAKRVNVRS